jgi:nucleoside-diphosphate kinase
MTERTLVLIKPDAIRRRLTGEILRRIEAKGYDIIALDMRRPTRGTLERHYESHRGKEYFPALIAFMLSGPSIAAVVDGPDDGRARHHPGGPGPTVGHPHLPYPHSRVRRPPVGPLRNRSMVPGPSGASVAVSGRG